MMRLGLLGLCGVMELSGCTLDSGGRGGLAGTGAVGGNAGIGGSSGTGGTTRLSFEDCQDIVQAQSGGRLQFACTFCLCSPPEQRDTVTTCDGLCWDLIQCVGNNCGIGDPDQLNCATARCGPFLGGAGSAIPISSMVQTCQPECGSLVSP